MNGNSTGSSARHPALDLIFGLVFTALGFGYWICETVDPAPVVNGIDNITAPVADLAPWLAAIAALLGLWLLYRVRTYALRLLAAAVCQLRGHKFFHPDGEVCSWVAYSCVRCNALDRALEDLPNAPGPDDDHYDERRYFDDDYQERVDQQWARAKRWISWLPWPRWS